MPDTNELRNMTLEQFIEWESQQENRWERLYSVTRMMTGGTIDHNRITRNLAAALASRLPAQCEVFTSDVKVISPTGDVLYPDVVVACGPIYGQANQLQKPVLIAKVLSQSTAERDHGRKRWAYQTMKSLQHYVLVDRNEPIVEVSARDQDVTWRSVIHQSLTDQAAMPAIDVVIPLAEIFDRVSFVAEDSGSESDA